VEHRTKRKGLYGGAGGENQCIRGENREAFGLVEPSCRARPSFGPFSSSLGEMVDVQRKKNDISSESSRSWEKSSPLVPGVDFEPSL